MRFNRVGTTELRMSEISFGAGTGAGLMIHGDMAQQVECVRAALDAGINHFDTAAFYGFGASEIYLGQALRAAKASDVVVTSKVAISREHLQARALGQWVRQSVEQSLSRLRRECIDVLLIHNATHRTHAAYDPVRESERVANIMNAYLPRLTFDDLMGEEGVCAAVERLKGEGKVRYFGLSGQDNDPDIIRAMVATGHISMFNQTYNLMNPSAGYPAARAGRRVGAKFSERQHELFIEFKDIIEFARTHEVGVSVISALAAGALTDAAVRGDPPAEVARRGNRFPFKGQFERQLEVARAFKSVADEAGMSLAELATRFVLSTPGVTTLVAGLSSSGQVEEICRYSDQKPLEEGLLAQLRRIWLQ